MDLPGVEVIFHEKNQGVGGATMTGFKKAMELNYNIVIKLDGDGQMDPAKITTLIQPLIEKTADYTKGNRFVDFAALKHMPRIRLFGNSALSFLVKAASGYWNIMDPTNGFVAITIDALRQLDLRKIGKRYFFEIDMLIHLNIINKVVKDVSIPAIYADEKSNLSVGNVLLTFPFKIIKSLIKRIFYKYYVYNFNMASIYFLLSVPLLSFGFILGIYKWTAGIQANTENSAGTIMLAALPIILGMQFLLQAISIDIHDVPEK